MLDRWCWAHCAGCAGFELQSLLRLHTALTTRPCLAWMAALAGRQRVAQHAWTAHGVGPAFQISTADSAHASSVERKRALAIACWQEDFNIGNMHNRWQLQLK